VVQPHRKMETYRNGWLGQRDEKYCAAVSFLHLEPWYEQGQSDDTYMRCNPPNPPNTGIGPTKRALSAGSGAGTLGGVESKSCKPSTTSLVDISETAAVSPPDVLISASAPSSEAVLSPERVALPGDGATAGYCTPESFGTDATKSSSIPPLPSPELIVPSLQARAMSAGRLK
jgi:hypothetical protein